MASSAPNGSSMSSTSASCASERASATRGASRRRARAAACWRRRVRLTRSRSSLGLRVAFARGTLRIFSGELDVARAVSHGNSADSWNISVVRASPASIVPAVGRSRPATRLSRVLLPQPDAPSRHTNSPGATSRLMLSSAWSALPCVPEHLRHVVEGDGGTRGVLGRGVAEDSTTSCGNVRGHSFGDSHGGLLAAFSALLRNDRS